MAGVLLSPLRAQVRCVMALALKEIKIRDFNGILRNIRDIYIFLKIGFQIYIDFNSYIYICRISMGLNGI
jgi:hypothetical protein